MTAYKEYYKGQEEKIRRDSGRVPVKPVKKYCWKMQTYVRLLAGRCMMEGCVHRGGLGCIQRIR